ncbi:MAG TPA: hypothetical protein VFZ05_04595 [Nitrososphaera sp.]
MLVFTKVARARFSPSFRERIVQVYSLFPELQDRQVKCGFISRGSRLAGSARSWTVPQQIALQPNASSTTIAHELTHLLQGNGVPHGEKACDIWAVSRLPPKLADDQPYYILRHWQRDRWLRHRESVRRLCVQAIEVRKTDRNYIKLLSGQLRQLR